MYIKCVSDKILGRYTNVKTTRVIVHKQGKSLFQFIWYRNRIRICTFHHSRSVRTLINTSTPEWAASLPGSSTSEHGAGRGISTSRLRSAPLALCLAQPSCWGVSRLPRHEWKWKGLPWPGTMLSPGRGAPWPSFYKNWLAEPGFKFSPTKSKVHGLVQVRPRDTQLPAKPSIKPKWQPFTIARPVFHPVKTVLCTTEVQY